jgi:hypothetical protein
VYPNAKYDAHEGTERATHACADDRIYDGESTWL